MTELDAARRSGGTGGAPSRITVRPATEHDLPTVVELRLALLREHSANPIYRRLRRDARERAYELFPTQLGTAHEITLLAERGGEVVGILRCTESQGLPLLFPARYGYISSVYVRAPARRGGVLRALLAEAIAWCAARGIGELRLHNAIENTVANAAWEALGFESVEYLRMRTLP